VVLRDGLLTQPDALNRNGLLVGDRALGVQGDLALFFGDVAAAGGLPAVGVGDRLALEADFLVADRDGLRATGMDGPPVVVPARSALELLAGVSPGLACRHVPPADGLV
jgi:hypothetical protein